MLKSILCIWYKHGWKRRAIALALIVKTHVCYVTRLKHCMVWFPIYLLIHSFSTLLIKLFTITLIKCCPSMFNFICLSSIIKPVLVFDAPVNCLQHLNALQTIAYMNLCQCLFCLTTTIAKPVLTTFPGLRHRKCAIARARLHTRLKFIRRAFYLTPKVHA